jgi:hypothetical protein
MSPLLDPQPDHHPWQYFLECREEHIRLPNRPSNWGVDGRLTRYRWLEKTTQSDKKVRRASPQVDVVTY